VDLTVIDIIKEKFASALLQILEIDIDIILLTILVVIIIILYDTFHLVFDQKSKATGMKRHTNTFSVDGSQTAPVKDYISDLQGLAGRPDAVIIEDGFAIPVERKPLCKKIRDRHVAQLLIYMRLIEEFHGERPPYGYLILGKNCRRVKIENSKQKQEWLQKMIDDMRGILNGAAAKPLPTPEKCDKCDVREHCKFRMLESQNAVKIKNGKTAKI
jgi:CRISPR/Cas system-associated exonuclease Cas4 (RecB family)